MVVPAWSITRIETARSSPMPSKKSARASIASRSLITLRRVGDPDGHGQYGILDVDEESVLCHECGRRPVDTGRPLVGRVACQCPMVLDHHQADWPIRPSGSGITSSRM